VLAVAAVQPVGHVPVVLGVALDVGVEHQQRDPADARDPDPRQQLGAVGERDADHRAGAVLLAQQRDRQAVGVEDGVGLLLPALARERLLEVAVPVEQADADDRDAEVAGGLEVVAGEDAETTGVLRQRGGDAELRGEVRDGAGALLARREAALEPAVPGQVLTKTVTRGSERGQELLRLRQLFQTAAADGPEQLDRITPGRLPQGGVDGLEDVLGLRVPGPPQVAGEPAQTGQRRRQNGTNGESTNRTHRATVPPGGWNDQRNAPTRRCGADHAALGASCSRVHITNPGVRR